MTTVYNVSKEPVIIVTKWSANPHGGPAEIETDHMIMPGTGIDLSIVGLEPKVDWKAECERLAEALRVVEDYSNDPIVVKHAATTLIAHRERAAERSGG